MITCGHSQSPMIPRGQTQGAQNPNALMRMMMFDEHADDEALGPRSPGLEHRTTSRYHGNSQWYFLGLMSTARKWLHSLQMLSEHWNTVEHNGL